MSGVTKFYTGTFTDGTGFTLSEADLAIQVSLVVLSGTCSITGNFFLHGNASSAITLVAGMSLTFSGYGLNPISGVTVTPSTPGSVGAIVNF